MQNKSIKKKESNGLTLIELLLVIAVLAIIAGMSMSALGEYIPDYRLQSAARELYANMHKAKMEAIKRNSNVRIVFDVSGERYAISVDDDGSGNWNDIDANENLKIIYLSKYHGDVGYGIGGADNYKGASENVVSYNDNIFYFYSSGRCNKNGYVHLENNKGNTYAVGTLQSGIISIFKWKNGDWES